MEEKKLVQTTEEIKEEFEDYIEAFSKTDEDWSSEQDAKVTEEWINKKEFIRRLDERQKKVQKEFLIQPPTNKDLQYYKDLGNAIIVLKQEIGEMKNDNM